MNNGDRPKKSLGQHWLRDDAALNAMCDAADVSSKDTVLEIGPGLGTLTEKLAERAKRVVAVEFDRNLAHELSQKYTSHNIEIVEQDILKFDLTNLPPDYKVVSNIPYYLTSNLIRVLSETANPPTIVALLVQKEVAERVVADPGDMSILSVTAQYYWDASLGRIVKAELFEPPPKVDSQILILKWRQKSRFENADSKEFFRIVKAGFSQRRKTLHNSISAGLQLNKSDVDAYLMEAKIEPATRAQSLSLEQWHDLYRTITESR